MIGERVVLKAPGKVLMAGGYGVLEEENVGLSLAVDRHFYSVSRRVDSEKEEGIIEVCVGSPQIGQKWAYRFNATNDWIQEEKGISNPFLQNAIFFALQYCKKITALKVKSIEIVILQDRGFLSQNKTVQQSRKFVNYSQGATKTGLGSSAGVIVVTVSALLKQITGQAPAKTVNALSQVANLAAQNKIGSNFDISTAVHGSHLYRNVLPRLAFETISTLDFKTLMEIDPKVSPLLLPSKNLMEGYTCMIDLKQGSNTRKMVSGFIKSLNAKDQTTIREFYEKSKEFTLAIYSLLTDSTLAEATIEKGLKKTNRQYRQFLQYYSSITGIPVEPPQFKPFLDELANLDRIIYAICPGSGGYDAIFVLTTATTPQQIIIIKQKMQQTLNHHNLQANLNDIRIVWGTGQLSQEQLIAIDKYLS